MLALELRILRTMPWPKLYSLPREITDELKSPITGRLLACAETTAKRDKLRVACLKVDSVKRFSVGMSESSLFVDAREWHKQCDEKAVFIIANLRLGAQFKNAKIDNTINALTL